MVACSKSDTIYETVGEILGYREDIYRVLGTAYTKEVIEHDRNKGIIEK